MHTFAVKALNVVLVISLVSAYHAVVSDRKADEAAAKKQLAEQQAAAENQKENRAQGQKDADDRREDPRKARHAAHTFPPFCGCAAGLFQMEISLILT